MAIMSRVSFGCWGPPIPSMTYIQGLRSMKTSNMLDHQCTFDKGLTSAVGDSQGLFDGGCVVLDSQRLRSQKLLVPTLEGYGVRNAPPQQRHPQTKQDYGGNFPFVGRKPNHLETNQPKFTSSRGMRVARGWGEEACIRAYAHVCRHIYHMHLPAYRVDEAMHLCEGEHADCCCLARQGLYTKPARRRAKALHSCLTCGSWSRAGRCILTLASTALWRLLSKST